ncbi:MAG: SH3 domain-containing protein [Planktotalea sp.]|uniref:SH3 domain-containing protein n=1 Tax=Planktotalea sp. TaxID=2029877 RepID=UPI003C769FC9
MGKIIVITFAFLGFAFYEMSGGDEFVPIAQEKRAALALEKAAEETRLAEAKAEQLLAAPAPKPQIVLASASATIAKPESQTDEAIAAVTAALETDKAEEIVSEEVAEAAIEETTANDIREVTAARVNMRNGPGQKFNVVAKLTNGEQVEILQDPGDGWVKLRVTDSGRVGWMADFLLTASNN